MDNSVYQPLSHALQPTSASTYPHDHHLHITHSNNNTNNNNDLIANHHHEHEEEEEEEDEIDALRVDSAAASAPNHHHHHHHHHQQQQQHHNASASVLPNSGSNSEPTRRRPGRPKGSKNKKKFEITDSSPKLNHSSTPFYGYTTPQPAQSVAAPVQASTPQPPPVPQPAVAASFPAPDPNNQAFYDFQWRVLTLCSEFYNAADELIRSAPQHIIAQCFNPPGSHVDPFNILNDARRACDQLMANPSQAVLKISQQQSVPPVPSPAPPAKDISTTPVTTTVPVPVPRPTATTTTPKPPVTPAPVITNPGSFVVSLSSSSPAQSAYTNFQPATNRYESAAYSYYATQTQQTGSHPYLAQQQVIKAVNLTSPAASGNQGAWSDEETEKLKQLTDDSKTSGTGTEHGVIDWDWVCNAWGPGRTRHQILIKATNMGLKESSTRGIKRRRETDQGTDEGSLSVNGSATGGTATSTQAVLNAVGAAADASASATPDRPASTSISPAAVHQQVAPAVPPPPGGGNLLHWATNMSSPVMSGGSSRSVYYNKGTTKA